MELKKNPSQINTILQLLQIATALSVLMQVAINQSKENILSVVLAAGSSYVALEYIKRSRCYASTPISTLGLLGLIITSTTASLITQSFYWTPLVHLLRAPELTFAVLALVQLLACITHWVYRKFEPFSKLPVYIGRAVFKPAGLYKVPSVYSLWLMGFVGLYVQISGHANFGDVTGKALQALGFMAWLPLLIPYFHATRGDDYCNSKTQFSLIALFLLALFLIGALRNVRQIMFNGPLQIALTYLLYLATHGIKTTFRSKVQLASAVIAGSVGVALAADLATSMVIAREKRLTSTGTEMLSETIQILTNERYRIKLYRDQFEMAAVTRLYDEAYISNPVLARFSATKFHDNMLFLGSNFAEENVDDLFFATSKRIFNLLPDPVAKLIDPKYDKAQYFFSMGDYYLYQLQGPQGLSSFIVGSIWADFYYMLHEWSPPAIFILFLTTIILLDALSTTKGSLAIISPIGFCWAVHVFLYGYGMESIAGQFGFFGRVLPQSILLYLIALHGLDGIFRAAGWRRALSID